MYHHVYVPHNLGICDISRLRCAFSESCDCVPMRLRTIVARSRDCATIVRNLQIAQITHAHYSWHRSWLGNCSTRDERQDNDDREMNFASASERFSYLACRPTMNGIVGRQHCSTTLHHFVQSNFSRSRREAHEKQKSVYLVAWINK